MALDFNTPGSGSRQSENDEISLLFHLLIFLCPISLILAVTLTLNLNTPGSAGSRQS
jgi:hypothetical protein